LMASEVIFVFPICIFSRAGILAFIRYLIPKLVIGSEWMYSYRKRSRFRMLRKWAVGLEILHLANFIFWTLSLLWLFSTLKTYSIFVALWISIWED